MGFTRWWCSHISKVQRSTPSQSDPSEYSLKIRKEFPNIDGDKGMPLSDKGWREYIEGIKHIIDISGIKVQADFDDDEILINGCDDEGCETFQITRDGLFEDPFQGIKCRGFNYCKTQEYPYDTIVAASLVLGYLLGFLKLGGDGDVHPDNPDDEENDFSDGLKLVKSIWL